MLYFVQRTEHGYIVGRAYLGFGNVFNSHWPGVCESDARIHLSETAPDKITRILQRVTVNYKQQSREKSRGQGYKFIGTLKICLLPVHIGTTRCKNTLTKKI
jgi:hypothetical protein